MKFLVTILVMSLVVSPLGALADIKDADPENQSRIHIDQDPSSKGIVFKLCKAGQSGPECSTTIGCRGSKPYSIGEINAEKSHLRRQGVLVAGAEAVVTTGLIVGISLLLRSIKHPRAARAIVANDTLTKKMGTVWLWLEDNAMTFTLVASLVGLASSKLAQLDPTLKFRNTKVLTWDIYVDPSQNPDTVVALQSYRTMLQKALCHIDGR